MSANSGRMSTSSPSKLGPKTLAHNRCAVKFDGLTEAIVAARPRKGRWRRADKSFGNALRSTAWTDSLDPTAWTGTLQTLSVECRRAPVRLDAVSQKHRHHQLEQRQQRAKQRADLRADFPAADSASNCDLIASNSVRSDLLLT